MQNSVNKKKTIPDFVVKIEEEKRFREVFSDDLNKCNQSWKSLIQMKDLDLKIDHPKNLSSDEINTYIDQRVNDVDATSMLTYDGKERAKREWEDIRSEAISHITNVLSFFEKYTDAEVMVNGDIIVCKNGDSIVYEHCKVRTPKPVYRHVELIEKVEKAIKDLQDFEKENDYPTGDLVNVYMDLQVSKDIEKLISNWLWQAERRAIIKKHSCLMEGLEMQTRKERAKHQAYLNDLAEKYAEDHPEYHKYS